MCKKIVIECEDKWFSHQSEPVLENDKSKTLCDFEIQTDKEIEHWRPNIEVTDKEKREWNIIDVDVRGDQKIKVKDLQKNHQIPGLEITVEKVVECQSCSYTYCR